MQSKAYYSFFVGNRKGVDSSKRSLHLFFVKEYFLLGTCQSFIEQSISRQVAIGTGIVLHFHSYFSCLLYHLIVLLLFNDFVLLYVALLDRRLIQVHLVSLPLLHFFPNQRVSLLLKGLFSDLKLGQLSHLHRSTYILSRLAPYNQIRQMEGGPVFLTFNEFKQALGSWQKPLQKFVTSKVFQDIYKYVKDEYESGKKIYPKMENIFNAFTKTPISNIKVVIVGQDPYHQPNQAHGLCFSVLKPVPPPPSLKNIYKNLVSNKLIQKAPSHGDLTKWAEQGVFMLNASLTVQDSKPNSHSKCGWQKFTDAVIEAINTQCKDVVFLLWGKPAQDKAKSVNPSKHCILKTSHPSPLSASQGFLTSKCFIDCNKFLEGKGKKPINWNID